MNQLLSRYFENDFFLIPIRKNEKRPLYKKWNEFPLSYVEARHYVKEGYNLAVVAKDLYILDFDERPKRISITWYRHFGTLVQFTPNGFHLYYKSKTEPNLDNGYIRFNGASIEKPDTIRHGDMYALVAPSKIDGKSYWWLDSCKGEILTL